MTVEQLFEIAEDPAITIDGFDDCILGLSLCNQHIIYDLDKIIAKIINEDDPLTEIDFQDAVEYFDYNINIHEGQPNAPIFLNHPVKEEKLPPKPPKSKHIGALYVCL